MRTVAAVFIAIGLMSAWLAHSSDLKACNNIKSIQRQCAESWSPGAKTSNYAELIGAIDDFHARAEFLLTYANARGTDPSLVVCDNDGGKTDIALGKCIWNSLTKDNLDERLTDGGKIFLSRRTSPRTPASNRRNNN